jgi:dephospho-CoA kinase
MPGAGKGECARLARESGITVVNMGDLVREYTKELGFKMVDSNIGSVAHTEREKHGSGIWAERTVEKISKMAPQNLELIIIDGIRSEAEITVFKKKFGECLKTAAVIIPAKKRFQLLQKRKRSDAPMTKKEFEIREAREINWGLNHAIDQADYIIMNTGTLIELEESFNEILSIIKHQD